MARGAIPFIKNAYANGIARDRTKIARYKKYEIVLRLFIHLPREIYNMAITILSNAPNMLGIFHRILTNTVSPSLKEYSTKKLYVIKSEIVPIMITAAKE